MASNWNASIPDLLNRLEGVDLGINEFFKLERNVSFKLASLVADVNSMAKILLDEPSDISSFAARLSNAFLPRTVYELEEYGLPRMLARKIHDAKLINLEDADMDLHGALGQLARIGLPRALDAIDGVLPFDEYVLNYFFDGIS